MTALCSKDGLFIFARRGERVFGLVVKPAHRMLYSERNGLYRFSLRIGPIFIRTYGRKAGRYAPPSV